MGRTFLFLLVSFITLHSFAQKNISLTITGKVLNTDAKSIFFRDLAEPYLDTALTLSPDKSFTFQVMYPHIPTLMVSTDNTILSILWFGEGETHVTFEEINRKEDTSGKKFLIPVDVTGSPESVASFRFKKHWQELRSKYSHLSREDSEDSSMAILYPELSRYILANPRSDYAAFLLLEFPINNLQRTYLLETFDKQVNPVIIQNIKNQVERQKAHRPGVWIPDWKQPRLDGSPFSLHSVKSNYIFLDFWNSKCIPCRKANHSLIRLYNKYHAKGFDIVGISLDTKYSEWKQAVEKDKLPWIQISDLNGWQNKISAYYVIRRLPYNILMNSKYEVVATDLNPRQLEAKLKQLFASGN